MSVAFADSPEAVASEALSRRLEELRSAHDGLSAQDFLRAMLTKEFPGKVAAVSSFGSESVVLLHMISEIDPSTPVLFLNTGKLFGETLRYRDRLQEVLGLTDLRAVFPHPDDLKESDPASNLWRKNPDGCCHIRKVLPLRRALESFDAEISGRKRFQTKARGEMQKVEINEGRIKLNPLAEWGLEDLTQYIKDHELPRHPLVKDGYLSIGCMPCTQRVQNPGDYRSGRWSGLDKDECGIHGIDGEGI